MNDIKLYDINDPNFVQDLLNSVEHVKKVAHWIANCGFQVKMPATRIRDKVENMSQFSDNGDLFVDENRVEVKQRLVPFVSQDTFPYDTIIVDVCHTWDNANPKPKLYILTNKAITGALLVTGDTFDKWKKVDKWDRFKSRYRSFYECPIELTTYVSLKESANLDYLFKK